MSIKALYKNYLYRMLIFPLALSIIFVGAVGADSPKDYLGCVSEALAALETGLTRESMLSLKKAVAYNANDPLAHVALGITLLSGGRTEDAMSEFTDAAELDTCAEALYGQGLVRLSKGQYESAIASFIQAQAARPDLDIQSAIDYARMMSNGSIAQVATESEDESLQALIALKLMNEGNHTEAINIWKELQAKSVRTTFGERIGCSMTFLKETPAALTGWPINEPYRFVSAAKSKLPVVSGTVTLKADLTRAQSVSMVAFFVDDVLVGITNHHPFQYGWNTRNTVNGSHIIKIKGNDNSGFTISEKSTEVMVSNSGKRSPSLVKGEAAAKVWGELWKSLKLKPSVAAINYNLAICAINLKDTEVAIGGLERVLAVDPTYRDAADRLSTLYQSNNRHVKLYKVDTDKKVIALTFDDGPKANTGELLDVLKKKNVKATFFVVGKQVETYPGILQKICDEGHEIQNHTYNHRDLEYLSDKDITLELFKTSAAVRSIVGKELRFIRPPGGHEGAKLPAIAKKFGLTTVFWTLNCSKFEGTKKEKIYNYIVSGAKPGAIILMHNAETVTLNALPGIIDELRKRGYTFVTLSEMVR